MSADLLRAAAAKAREVAEAASSGPWVAFRAHDTKPNGPDWIGVTRDLAVDYDPDVFASQKTSVADAEHIALWHPGVALAVADWLDGVALLVEAKDDEEYFDLDGDPIAPEDTHAIGSALTVARLLLGGSHV